MSAKPAGKGGYPNRNGFDSRQPKLEKQFETEFAYVFVAIL